MPLAIACTQHHGKDWRFPTQQDALWNGIQVFQARNLGCKEYIADGDLLTIAVADGVGSSPQAELASRLVLDTLAAEISAGAAFDVRLVHRLQGRLCDALAKGATFGSATTLAAAQCRGERCSVLNIGDSRVYRIADGGEWQQLSHDHTVINAMIDRGEADAGREYASIYNILDSCLVADDEETEFAVHRSEAPFLPGDSLLLCTDGVHDTLSSDVLKRLTDPSLSPQEQVRTWRKAVLAAGAPDNFSMVLVRRC